MRLELEHFQVQVEKVRRKVNLKRLTGTAAGGGPGCCGDSAESSADPQNRRRIREVRLRRSLRLRVSGESGSSSPRARGHWQYESESKTQPQARAEAAQAASLTSLRLSHCATCSASRVPHCQWQFKLQPCQWQLQPASVSAQLVVALAVPVPGLLAKRHCVCFAPLASSLPTLLSCARRALFCLLLPSTRTGWILSARRPAQRSCLTGRISSTTRGSQSPEDPIPKRLYPAPSPATCQNGQPRRCRGLPVSASGDL